MRSCWALNQDDTNKHGSDLLHCFAAVAFFFAFFPCIAAKINATTDCGTFFIQVDLGISWYMAMSHNPGTPGEHQNSWQMDVHPIKNGINRY